MLLIACNNFMNMTTTRAAGRAREVGLRKVVGANRLQLIRQFLGESILKSVFALFLAVALVQMVIPVFNTFAGKDLTLAFNESGLILGLVGITLFVGIVSGSYPAFFLSGFQPGAVLKESVKTGGGHAVLRKTLVVVQFAISTILIIGTGVAYDQLDYVRNKRLGFDKDHVITVPAAIQPILAVVIYMVWPLRFSSRITSIIPGYSTFSLYPTLKYRSRKKVTTARTTAASSVFSRPPNISCNGGPIYMLSEAGSRAGCPIFSSA
jgi:hypothetical protein